MEEATRAEQGRVLSEALSAQMQELGSAIANYEGLLQQVTQSADATAMAIGGIPQVNHTLAIVQSGTNANGFGVGGCAPNNGNIGYYPPTTLGVQYDPCPSGHVASEETVEYIDGVIVGTCSTCGSRLQVNRVSGGVSILRIKHLLGVVMAIDEETVQLPDWDESETLGEFGTIKDLLEAEEFALRQARKLLDLAGKVLAHKAEL